MTDANLRVSGARLHAFLTRVPTLRGLRPFAGANLAGVALAALLTVGCSSGPVHLGSPACQTMQAQIKEKQKLDAEVKALAKAARDSRKQGDTTSAVSAERRLENLVEQQRYLKDALDNTSRDCTPGMQDTEPPLDPAVREKQRLEGTR